MAPGRRTLLLAPLAAPEQAKLAVALGGGEGEEGLALEVERQGAGGLQPGAGLGQGAHLGDGGGDA
ncbi:hypothetical protein, partial [Paracraurococcus ruber]|uniref:hypothetical protein n=1 Tax=Paracraurococcus ruber TaxID=77675 RepID=UPI001A938753